MPRVPKSKVFLWTCVALVVGVGVGSYFGVPEAALVVGGFVGVWIVLLGRRHSLALTVGLGMMALVAGCWRYQAAMPTFNKYDLASYHGSDVTFDAVVAAEPDTRDDRAYLTLEAREGRYRLPANITGRALVPVPLYPVAEYGDLYRVACTLEAPEPIVDDAGRVFQYDKYLAKSGIYSLCRNPQLERIGSGQGSPWLSVALAVKNSFVGSLQESLAEPYASFAGGLLLGAKKAMPEKLLADFNTTGVTHIVALSGYNITIIVVAIAAVCRAAWIPRRYWWLASLLAVCFFVVITGAQASVVRAGVMGMLVAIAGTLGRMSRITNSLALAAAIMVLVNPYVLAFDTGFQLSFLATLGLVYVSPFVEKLLRWVPEAMQLRSNLSATLSATLATLPLITVTFGRLSLVASLTNVLILPAIAVAMLASFLAAVAGLLSGAVGQVVGWSAWLVLRYVIEVIGLTAQLPWAATEVRIPAPVAIACYLAGAIGLFILHNRYRHAPKQ